MQFHIGANVIIEREGMILLGLRLGFGAKTWGLPGGHVEPNESFEHAAMRELVEETGLLVSRLEFSSLVDQPDKNDHYMQVTFIGHEDAGEMGAGAPSQDRRLSSRGGSESFSSTKKLLEPELLEPHECSEWRWFGLHDLPENLFYPHATPLRLYIEKSGSFGFDDRLAS